MTKTFSIRPLNTQDETFLWEILYQAIHIPPGQQPLPRNVLQEPSLAHYVFRWGHRPGDLGFAVQVTETKKPVGAAWLRLFSKLDPGYGFVSADIPELSIAILPGYRGLGLGSRLLSALLDVAALQFIGISLSVSKDNPAGRLYERLGFIVVGEDESSLTMLKQLRKSTDD